jgi:hypothetical protein
MGCLVSFFLSGALLALVTIFTNAFSSEVRTPRDQDVIELVLTIFRNILSVPDPEVCCGAEK